MSSEHLDHVVTGALFDFVAYLTTQQKPIICSSSNNAAPLVEALGQFIKLNDIDPNATPLYGWQGRCSMLNQQEDVPDPTPV